MDTLGGHYSANHKEGDRERTSGFSQGAGPFTHGSDSGAGGSVKIIHSLQLSHHSRAA